MKFVMVLCYVFAKYKNFGCINSEVRLLAMRIYNRQNRYVWESVMFGTFCTMQTRRRRWSTTIEYVVKLSLVSLRSFTHFPQHPGRSVNWYLYRNYSVHYTCNILHQQLQHSTQSKMVMIS